jgi:hypothetical protein
VACLGLFVLAAIGWFSGLSPLDCALRALTGSAVLLVLVTVGGRIVINIVVDTMMEQKPTNRKEQQP